MQIFRSGIKGNSRKRAEWGVRKGGNVGVEETKEDKRKTAKSVTDKEGEREFKDHKSKNLQQTVQKKKAGKN